MLICDISSDREEDGFSVFSSFVEMLKQIQGDFLLPMFDIYGEGYFSGAYFASIGVLPHQQSC